MAHFLVDEDLPRSLVRALHCRNFLRFPRGSHHGIVVTRFPNELPTTTMNADIVRALGDLSDEELRGNLVILEPGRIRLRRGR